MVSFLNPNEALVAFAFTAFLVGTAASRFIRTPPIDRLHVHTTGGLITLADTTRLRHRTGDQEVFYPVLFAKIPHLNVSVRGISEYEIADQRRDGFTIQVRRLYGLTVWDFLFGGCTVRWEAKGIIDKSPSRGAQDVG